MKNLYTNTGDGYLRSGFVRFHEALEPLLVPIDSVTQHPENDNNGDEDLVQQSIMINGMYNAIKVQASTGHIAAGNTTWTVCKKMESLVIPIVRLAIDDIETLRIMLADNGTARAAVRDDALTRAALERIAAAGESLEGTTFSLEDLERMDREAAIPADLEVDPYDGWPTFSAMVSPATFRELMLMTEDADEDGNRGRLEYLMREAGWDGP